MNPILLKPDSDRRSQVIILGRPLASHEARMYYQQRAQFVPVVQQALASLRSTCDLVIIEGAGSPVELNLAQYDLVNMAVARMADAPVILVGDIDRGGIFASLLGTLALLPPEDLARVRGLVVNKFRGDLALWQPGQELLEQKSGLPVFGTVPFFPNLGLAEEDSVPLDERSASIMRVSREHARELLKIVVVRLPYMSNFDEFDVLAADPSVHLHVAGSAVEFPTRPDLIVLPGTKNTLHDLAWLWRQGLTRHIRTCVQKGSAILGICGGYQMLGERVSDPAGIEAAAGTIESGLNLLPVETTFASLAEKITTQSQPIINEASRRGLFAHLLPEHPFQAYQIHTGRTLPMETKGTVAFRFPDAETMGDGWLSFDGWRAGCYFHGLFENDHFRRGLLTALAERRSPEFALIQTENFDKQAAYDHWAGFLRQHLDLAQLKRACQLL
jgi:adenosylcobyric acid synthase